MQSAKIQRFTFFSDFGIGNEVICSVFQETSTRDSITLVKSTVLKIELTEVRPIYILASGHHVDEADLVSSSDSEGVKNLVMKEFNK
jgi:hypothetical protein